MISTLCIKMEILLFPCLEKVVLVIFAHAFIVQLLAAFLDQMFMASVRRL